MRGGQSVVKLPRARSLIHNLSGHRTPVAVPGNLALRISEVEGDGGVDGAEAAEAAENIVIIIVVGGDLFVLKAFGQSIWLCRANVVVEASPDGSAPGRAFLISR